MRKLHTIIMAGLLLAASRVHGQDKALPLIAVSNYPLQWVCETLAGKNARIINLTREAADPRAWVPDDQALQHLQTADVVVLQGGGYEKWAEGLRMDNALNTSARIPEEFFRTRLNAEEPRELYYARINGKAWLDPLHLEQQAVAVSEALSRWVPEAELQKNLKTIREPLAELTRDLKGNPRLNRERILSLDSSLAYTLGPALGWLLYSPEFKEAPLGHVPEPTTETMAIVERSHIDFPFRLAIATSEVPAEWEEKLQQNWGIWTCAFDAGDRPSPAHADYPAMMRHNFKQLTSGFLP